MLGEIRFHDYFGREFVLEEIEKYLSQKDWVLSRNADDYGSEWGNWYEVFDFSKDSERIVCSKILQHDNNKHLRNFSYIFICENPNKIAGMIKNKLKYAYFKYFLVTNNGNELVELIKSILK